MPDAGHLADMYDDGFSWLEWLKSNEDVDTSIVDVVLCGDVPIALTKYASWGL